MSGNKTFTLNVGRELLCGCTKDLKTSCYHPELLADDRCEDCEHFAHANTWDNPFTIRQAIESVSCG